MPVFVQRLIFALPSLVGVSVPHCLASPEVKLEQLGQR